MKCIVSNRKRQAIRRSKEIDKTILRDNRKRNNIDILLIGNKNAGKNTVLRQIDQFVTYENKNNEEIEEKKIEHKLYIQRTIIASLKVILDAMKSSNVNFENDQRSNDAELIYETQNTKMSTRSGHPLMEIDFEYTGELACAVERLWNDAGVEKVYKEQVEQYKFDDTKLYVLNSLERCSKADYVPSFEDILRTKPSTSSLIELTFTHRNLSYNILNVGGLEEMTLRRKWMHYFEYLGGGIIFVVALDCYDMISDDGSTNQMTQSLELFDSYINNHWGQDTKPIFVLFNKDDLFREKICHTPLTVCFPEYSGLEGNYEDAYNYIQMKFKEVNKTNDRIINCHKLCALDSYGFSFIFKGVIETIHHALITCNCCDLV